MTNSISTFGQANYLTSQIMQLETTYGSTSVQESSGLISQNFSGIADNTQQALNLEDEYNNITTQTSNATNASNKSNAIGSALTSASGVLTQAISNLSSAISNSNDNGTAANEQTQLQADLSELTAALNTQYAGNYVFGGSNTSTQPVNLSAAGYTGLTSTTANTSYYQGDDTTDSVQVNNSLTVNYGVTADNPAFEQALRGLSLAIADPTDTTTLQAAYGLLQQASTGVASLGAANTTTSNVITSQITINQSTLNYLQNNISDLTNADTTQVASQLSALQTQLDASYSILADLSKLNLSDYLK